MTEIDSGDRRKSAKDVVKEADAVMVAPRLPAGTADALVGLTGRRTFIRPEERPAVGTPPATGSRRTDA